MEFKGISKDILFLMEDNRFRDSKTFYEEHKEELKQGFTVPMRQIAGYFGEKMVSADPLMNINPVRMVSRIRRDTRFSKDKHLYRDNMWIMFMRPKSQWENYPCMWFEASPRDYNHGITFFGSTPGLMETFRSKMKEKPEEFRKAISAVEKTGSVFFNKQYKRPFPDAPEGLEKYYNSKDFGFMNSDPDITVLGDNRIIERLDKVYESYMPLYVLLLEVSDAYFERSV